jgi:hypothetical protein
LPSEDTWPGQATQNQALAAVLFLYKEVLEQPLGRIKGIVRAKRKSHIPVVLTQDETIRVLSLIEGISGLICKLQYGSGLRSTRSCGCA